MTVCGDQTFLEQMKWSSYQFSCVCLWPVYWHLLMQFNWCFNEILPSHRSVLLIPGQGYSLRYYYGPKLKYKRPEHAALDNVTYDISVPSLGSPTYRPTQIRAISAPITSECQKTINMHSGASRDPNGQWMIISTFYSFSASYFYESVDRKVWTQSLEMRNIFCF